MVRLTRRLSGSRLTIVVFNSPGGSFAPLRLLPALACLHNADSARPGGLPWRGATGSPSAASSPPGRPSVRGRAKGSTPSSKGADNALWHKWFAGGWSDWESLGWHHRRLSRRGVVVVGPHRCLRARHGQRAVAQVVRWRLARLGVPRRHDHGRPAVSSWATGPPRCVRQRRRQRAVAQVVRRQLARLGVARRHRSTANRRRRRGRPGASMSSRAAWTTRCGTNGSTAAGSDWESLGGDDHRRACGKRVGAGTPRCVRQGRRQRDVAQVVRRRLERLGVIGWHHRQHAGRRLVEPRAHRYIRSRHGQRDVAQVVDANHAPRSACTSRC